MPNPVPGSTYDRQYRRAMEWTLTQSSGPSHVGQDTLPGLQSGQVPDYDWPNPRGYPRAREYGWVQPPARYLQDTLAGVATGQAPDYEWSQPRAYPRARDYGFVQSSPIWQQDTISGGDPGEAYAYDWPQPRSYPKARDYGWVQSGASIGVPSLLFDLSIPRAYPRARDYGFASGSPIWQADNVTGIEGAAPVYAWPVPGPYARLRDYSWVQAAPAWLYPLVVSVPYDWQQPRPHARAFDYGFTQSSPIWLFPLGPPGLGSAITGLGYPPGSARVTVDLSYQPVEATSNNVPIASGVASSVVTPAVLAGQAVAQSGPAAGEAVRS
jgi:hypothetical protein